jgi:pSer/pThr/pTyr-binding forkhead associated (FHA) protein
MHPEPRSKIEENAYLILDNQVFPLTAPITNIGRRLTNHLVIENKHISRVHAQIRRVRGRFFIVDLNSTGGTFVNGKRIEQAMLFPGDKISLAGVTALFRQENTGMLEDSEDSTSPLDE